MVPESLVGAGLVVLGVWSASSLVLAGALALGGARLRPLGPWAERRAAALALILPPLLGLGAALCGAPWVRAPWVRAPWALIAVALAATYALLRLGLTAWAHARAQLTASRLRRAASPVPGCERAFLVPGEGRFAFTTGILSPVIVVSRGTWAALDADQRDALLAHEQAHVVHGDLWKRAALGLLARLGAPVLAARALARWEQASERACDLAAVARVGRPDVVAGTILALARLRGAAVDPAAAGFAAASDVADRVRALLALALVLTLTLTPALACDDPGGATPDGAAPTEAGLDAGVDRGAPDLPPPDAAVTPDVFVPFSLLVTVNRIPAAMNGSVPFTNLSGAAEPFSLTVPTHGFSVDVIWQGSEARPTTLKVSADRALGSAGAAVAAGADLAPRFSVGSGSASLLIPASLAAPTGSLTLTATMADKAQTLSSQLTVDVADKTFLLDPFRLQDTWLLVLDQDHYTIGLTTTSSGAPAVSATAKANGLPDLDEDLRLIGLGSASMLPAAAAVKARGVTGTNAIVRAWLVEELLETVRGCFLQGADGAQGPDSVKIAFLLQGDPGAPALSSFTTQVLTGGETSKNFSAISIGGGDLSKAWLGLSKGIDPRNLKNEPNVGPTYGVFTTKAVSMVFSMLQTDPAVKLLAQTFFGDFIPALGKGGKPVGEHALDATILAAGFDPKQASGAEAARHQKLTFLVETLGRLIGALTAHEIGHALGLVEDGPPPYGLFGGEKNAAFTGATQTTGGHIDTAGFNLMEAGPGSASGAAFNVAQYLTTPRFNELNLAYLQGRVLLLPAP